MQICFNLSNAEGIVSHSISRERERESTDYLSFSTIYVYILVIDVEDKKWIDNRTRKVKLLISVEPCSSQKATSALRVHTNRREWRTGKTKRMCFVEVGICDDVLFSSHSFLIYELTHMRWYDVMLRDRFLYQRISLGYEFKSRFNFFLF